ncbi:MAG TPA: hypothetical protein ENO11_01290 [Desulfobacteraceae bacterium]|nr:hypothetical protein [Desulfobacteraceae bacterium]
MRKWTITALVALSLLFPVMAAADECIEGDCDNGYGTGFTEDSLIYEGEWKDGVPHGQGKLFLSGGRIVEGRWENGEPVKETAGEEEKEVNEE